MPPFPLRRVLRGLALAAVALAPLLVEHVGVRNLWEQEADDRARQTTEIQASLVEERLKAFLDRLVRRTGELATDEAIRDVAYYADLLPEEQARRQERAHRRLVDVAPFLETGALAWVLSSEGRAIASSLDASSGALLADVQSWEKGPPPEAAGMRRRVKVGRVDYLEFAAPVRPDRPGPAVVPSTVVVRVPADPVDRWLVDAARTTFSASFVLVAGADGRCVFDTRGGALGEPLPSATPEDLSSLHAAQAFGPDTEAILRGLHGLPWLVKALAGSQVSRPTVRRLPITSARLEGIFVSASAGATDFTNADRVALVLGAVVILAAFGFGFARSGESDSWVQPSMTVPALSGLAVLAAFSAATLYFVHSMDARGREATRALAMRIEEAMIEDLRGSVEHRAAFFAQVDDSLLGEGDLRAKFFAAASFVRGAYPDGELVLVMRERTEQREVVLRDGAKFDPKDLPAGLAVLPPGTSLLERPEVRLDLGAAAPRLVFDAPFRTRSDQEFHRLLWVVDLAGFFSEVLVPARMGGFDAAIAHDAAPSRALYPSGAPLAGMILGHHAFNLPVAGAPAFRLALRGPADLFGAETTRLVVLLFGLFLSAVAAILTTLLVGSNTTYRRASRIDPLTGLRNRLDFREILPREVERAKRHARDLSLVILDLDHFKRINDQYKHATGDELLRAAAAELERTVRRTDLVFRYGGEEFAILLPETPNEAARVVIDRVRERFARAPLRGLERIGVVTFSAGVATWRDDESTDAFVDRADSAMYEAKNAGRNRVVVARAERSRSAAAAGTEAARAV